MSGGRRSVAANIEAVIRKARANDLPLLHEIERAADELFRNLGMDAIADVSQRRHKR